MFKKATNLGKVAGYRSAASMARQRAAWHAKAGRGVDADVWYAKAEVWDAKAVEYIRKMGKLD